MEFSVLKRRLAHVTRPALGTLLLVGGTMSMSSCKDDLLTGTPEWLGSSIYEQLESWGNFSHTLELINDPELSSTDGSNVTEYAKILKTTGSRTMFVADDDAWQRFFKQRGISSTKELSVGERKSLLKASMLNSAYLIELLSSRQAVDLNNDPVEGVCLRRESLLDPMDNVPFVKTADMPEINTNRQDANHNTIDYWGYVRDRSNGGILLLKDENSSPMVHFLPRYMSNYSITSDDFKAISNGAAHDVSQSYINGRLVTKQDVTCQNGYIHVLSDVPEPLTNMADLISQKPQFSQFSRLLERFSYPEYSEGLSNTYNSLYNYSNGKIDSVFVKRYFNNSSVNPHTEISETHQKGADQIAFDPGWNHLEVTRLNLNGNDVGYQDDGGVIIAPTDKALTDYFNSSPLREYYKNWDLVPDDVVKNLINNHLLTSFRASVPSKFSHVKNSAGDSLGIQASQVDSCFVCNNGIVYQSNTVFVAPEYQSVLFPALIRGGNNGTTTVANKMIGTDNTDWTLREYQAYLNSTGSVYSFIIPTDAAFRSYYDPATLYRSEVEGGPLMYHFYIDGDASTIVSATSYKYDKTTGIVDETPVKTLKTNDMAFLMNRLEDILNNSIIVQTDQQPKFHSGQTIYINKAGGPVKVKFVADTVYAIGGSGEMEKGDDALIPIERSYDQYKDGGNGVAYVVPQLPTSTFNSPVAVINNVTEHPAFTLFSQMLNECSFVQSSKVDGKATMENNPAISFLNAYHYTIYVPETQTIQDLIDAKKLPSLELLDGWKAYLKYLKEDEKLGADDERVIEADSLVNLMTSVIENFVRYHIQDNSIYLGGEKVTAQNYETSSRDPETQRYRRLKVTNDGTAITVEDMTGKTHNVLNTTDSNLPGRQYIFNTESLGESSQLYSSAYAVVHLIDTPMEYSVKQYLDPAKPITDAPAIPDSSDSSDSGSSQTSVKYQFRNSFRR